MVDDTIKIARDLMRTLDSPEMREMRRVIEERKKALGGVDLAMLKEARERADYLKNFTGISGASDQISKAMLDLARTSRIYSDSIFGTEAIRQIASASDAWSRQLAHAAKYAESGVAGLGRIQVDQLAKLAENIKQPEWLRQIRDLSITVKGFELAGFQSRFASFGRIVEQAEASMLKVQWENISSLKIAPMLLNSLEARTEQLNRSFAVFADRMVLEPRTVVSAPPFISKLPPLAVYSHAEALRFISLPPDEEEEPADSPEEELWTGVRDQALVTIEDLLPRINASLLNSWKGGWDTAQKRSPDWARQASSSFRFVLSMALDHAAPPDLVKASLDPKNLKNGRVSRKQQISWLCGSLQNEAYRDMVLADLESATSVINLFSEAVHKYKHEEVEKSFPRVAVRAAIALQHILELHFNSGPQRP